MAVTVSLEGQESKQGVDLPSSKAILSPVPGSPQRLNSLPMAFALSADKKYTAIVNAGYGTMESDYQQSVALFDNATGKLTDFPEQRTGLRAGQTLYNGENLNCCWRSEAQGT